MNTFELFEPITADAIMPESVYDDSSSEIDSSSDIDSSSYIDSSSDIDSSYYQEKNMLCRKQYV